MSLDELRRLGSLVDEEEWSAENHRSNVRLVRFLPCVIVGMGGCAAAALGNGGWLTWVGIAAFQVGLFSFIVVNVRAIDARG